MGNGKILESVLCDRESRMAFTVLDSLDADIGDFNAASCSICSVCSVTEVVDSPAEGFAAGALRFALMRFNVFPMNKIDEAV